MGCLFITLFICLSITWFFMDLRSSCHPRHPRDQPLQQQTLSQVSVTQHFALQMVVQRKLAANLSACREAGVDCILILAETLGGLAKDAIHTIHSPGQVIAERASSRDPPSTTRHLIQRFTVAVWCGNASLWLQCHATLPSFLDGVV